MSERAERAANASYGQHGIAKGLAALVYALMDGVITININVNLRDVTRENDYPALPNREDLR
jgi:hypothetical protein